MLLIRGEWWNYETVICTSGLKKHRKESKVLPPIISFGNYISPKKTESIRRAIFYLLIVFLHLLLKKFKLDVIKRHGRPSSLYSTLYVYMSITLWLESGFPPQRDLIFCFESCSHGKCHISSRNYKRDIFIWVFIIDKYILYLKSKNFVLNIQVIIRIFIIPIIYSIWLVEHFPSSTSLF